MTLKVAQKLERILAVDIIRGYFIFVIVIDHLGRFPGLFEIFTGKGQLWVSAAEGFFFVSGMMIGLVRGRRALNKSFKQVTKLILKRAWILYVWSVILTLGFTAIALIFDGNEGIKPGLTWSRDIWVVIKDTLLLEYVYGWTDFLGLYAKYLLFSPIAIWLLRKGRWYILLAISIIIWARSGSAHDQGWQILFFGGAIVGYYLETIEAVVQSWRRTTKRGILYLLYGSTIATLSASVFAIQGRSMLTTLGLNQPEWMLNTRIAINDTFGPSFERISLQWPRLAMFLLWFTALYVLVRRYEQQIIKYTKDFFTLFGQHSLYVYIFHGIVVFLYDMVVPRQGPFLRNVFINVVGLYFFYWAAKRKFLFKIIPS